jgi:hypothetical protein
MNAIEQDLVRELFKYRDGKLFWREYRSNRALKDSKAGSHYKIENYINISINKTRYKAHRLIWIYHHGKIGDFQIDHINGNRIDNRIENLRLVTHQENHFNQTKAKGYTWNKINKNWRAQININGTHYNLGSFNTEEEARQAYLEAKERYHIIKER